MQSVFSQMRRRNVARLCATAFAAVFLAGQVSSYLHMALVRHVQCAEHGELIHSGRATPALATPASPAPIPLVASSTNADLDHSHEHCAATPNRRQAAIEITHGPLLAERPPQIGRAPIVARDLLIFGEPRYRLAPKNSPPA